MAADLVVLANTPIEATRLSILSGIAAKTLVASAAEPSGLLGRNLMFHLQTIGVAILDQDIHSWRGRCSTHNLDAFAGAGPSAAQFNADVPRGGILEMGGNYNPISQASVIPLNIFGAAHKEFMRLGPFTKRITSLTLQGEDMPQSSNCVDLDPAVVDVFGQPVPRITYKNHPYELSAMAYYIPKMEEILESIGGPGSPYSIRTLASGCFSTGLAGSLPGQVGSEFASFLAGTPISPVPSSAHIMGTHRMALDRGHGPCDPYGRFWEFDNLLHAGGGLFCTAPGYNVSLTMWALSYRVAAAVVAGVGGRDEYTMADIDADQTAMERVIRRLDSNTMIARALGR